MFGTFLRSQQASATEPAHRQAHPRLEELEARTLLSVFTPDQIRHAYGFDQVAFTTPSGHRVAADGTGQTIAIIDAYRDPNIMSDLRYFDWTFGLPDPPRFTVAMPQGAGPVRGGWALETALDVEWAHAIAPGANILLVEAASSSWSDLFGAIDYARSQAGVSVISMSFGSGQWPGEGSFDFHFLTPAGHRGGANLPGGITFVAASGDNGAGSLWPAGSTNVLSVGATSLRTDDLGTYQGETGWGWSGGGYSYEGEPRYQRPFQNSGWRSTPDVSYNGNPWTGFYVYDTVPYGWTGWFQVGGTSAGAPQWAALVAIVDQGRALAGKGSLDGGSQTLPAIYQLSSSDFHDIITGNNGHPAGRGYDVVTGRGSPYANRVIPDLVRMTLGTGSAAPHSAAAFFTSPGRQVQHTSDSVNAEPMPVRMIAAQMVDVDRKEPTPQIIESSRASTAQIPSDGVVMPVAARAPAGNVSFQGAPHQAAAQEVLIFQNNSIGGMMLDEPLPPGRSHNVRDGEYDGAHLAGGEELDSELNEITPFADPSTALLLTSTAWAGPVQLLAEVLNGPDGQHLMVEPWTAAFCTVLLVYAGVESYADCRRAVALSCSRT
jgi:hypothetical protein